MTGVPDLAAWLRAAVTNDLGSAKYDLGRVRRPGYYGCQDSLCEEEEVLERAARCEAELGILDEHGPAWHVEDLAGTDRWQVCVCCADGHWPCRTVRLLGGGYGGRPGYREEWAP